MMAQRQLLVATDTPPLAQAVAPATATDRQLGRASTTAGENGRPGSTLTVSPTITRVTVAVYIRYVPVRLELQRVVSMLVSLELPMALS